MVNNHPIWKFQLSHLFSLGIEIKVIKVIEFLSYCFHSDSELSYGKTARLTARLILAVVLHLICLISDHVSGILDTTDTNFLPPCLWRFLGPQMGRLFFFEFELKPTGKDSADPTQH